ncbi:uncharacterized protein LOC141915376 [Tubulanus polymorphus]|uniref:uncharacterized protein LOC141915376 n=1 Tax=Tubulanus polymorphus TaxID=672921 RepID=UPI003DA32F1C
MDNIRWNFKPTWIRLMWTILVFVLGTLSVANTAGKQKCSVKSWYEKLSAEGKFDGELSDQQKVLKSTIENFVKANLKIDCKMLQTYSDMFVEDDKNESSHDTDETEFDETDMDETETDESEQSGIDGKPTVEIGGKLKEKQADSESDGKPPDKSLSGEKLKDGKLSQSEIDETSEVKLSDSDKDQQSIENESSDESDDEKLKENGQISLEIDVTLDHDRKLKKPINSESDMESKEGNLTESKGKRISEKKRLDTRGSNGKSKESKSQKAPETDEKSKKEATHSEDELKTGKTSLSVSGKKLEEETPQDNESKEEQSDTSSDEKSQEEMSPKSDSKSKSGNTDDETKVSKVKSDNKEKSEENIPKIEREVEKNVQTSESDEKSKKKLSDTSDFHKLEKRKLSKSETNETSGDKPIDSDNSDKKSSKEKLSISESDGESKQKSEEKPENLESDSDEESKKIPPSSDADERSEKKHSDPDTNKKSEEAGEKRSKGVKLRKSESEKTTEEKSQIQKTDEKPKDKTSDTDKNKESISIDNTIDNKSPEKQFIDKANYSAPPEKTIEDIKPEKSKVGLQYVLHLMETGKMLCIKLPQYVGLFVKQKTSFVPSVQREDYQMHQSICDTQQRMCSKILYFCSLMKKQSFFDDDRKFSQQVRPQVTESVNTDIDSVNATNRHDDKYEMKSPKLQNDPKTNDRIPPQKGESAVNKTDSGESDLAPENLIEVKPKNSEIDEIETEKIESNDEPKEEKLLDSESDGKSKEQTKLGTEEKSNEKPSDPKSDDKSKEQTKLKTEEESKEKPSDPKSDDKSKEHTELETEEKSKEKKSDPQSDDKSKEQTKLKTEEKSKEEPSDPKSDDKSKEHTELETEEKSKEKKSDPKSDDKSKEQTKLETEEKSKEKKSDPQSDDKSKEHTELETEEKFKEKKSDPQSDDKSKEQTKLKTEEKSKEEPSDPKSDDKSKEHTELETDDKSKEKPSDPKSDDKSKEQTKLKTEEKSKERQTNPDSHDKSKEKKPPKSEDDEKQSEHVKDIKSKKEKLESDDSDEKSENENETLLKSVSDKRGKDKKKISDSDEAFNDKKPEPDAPVVMPQAIYENVKLNEEIGEKQKEIDIKTKAHDDKIKMLELQILRLENQLLHEKMNKNNDSAMITKLENYMLKLENELLKINHSFSILKSENEIISKSNRKFMQLENKRQESESAPSSGIANVTKALSNIEKQQSRITQLAKMINGQTTVIEYLKDQSTKMEEENRRLKDLVMSQSMAISQVLTKLNQVEEGLNKKELRVKTLEKTIGEINLNGPYYEKQVATPLSKDPSSSSDTPSVDISVDHEKIGRIPETSSTVAKDKKREGTDDGNISGKEEGSAQRTISDKDQNTADSVINDSAKSEKPSNILSDEMVLQKEGTPGPKTDSDSLDTKPKQNKEELGDQYVTNIEQDKKQQSKPSTTPLEDISSKEQATKYAKGSSKNDKSDKSVQEMLGEDKSETKLESIVDNKKDADQNFATQTDQKHETLGEPKEKIIEHKEIIEEAGKDDRQGVEKVFTKSEEQQITKQQQHIDDSKKESLPNDTGQSTSTEPLKSDELLTAEPKDGSQQNEQIKQEEQKDSPLSETISQQTTQEESTKSVPAHEHAAASVPVAKETPVVDEPVAVPAAKQKPAAAEHAPVPVPVPVPMTKQEPVAAEPAPAPVPVVKQEPAADEPRKILYVNEKHYRAKDCYELLKQGRKRDGIMNISPIALNGRSIKSFCDMKNGGWTVIQRRQSGNIDFFKTWNEYRDGFGDLLGEHWLGNDYIHQITNQGEYVLKIEMTDWERNKVSATYEDFWIDDGDNGYRLHVSGYEGNAGDGLKKHDNEQFSTKDVDNDRMEKDFGGSCAKRFSGAWWYYKCYQSNLNGVYYRDGKVADKKFDGVAWKPWKGPKYSIRRVEMKIRPKTAKN